MAKFSRDKGARNERKVVEKINAHGLEAHRVPLSGAMSHYKGDVRLGGWNIECKVRANGFKQIYGWIDSDSDFLVIGADRKQLLAVIDLGDLCDILAGRHTKTVKQLPKQNHYEKPWG